jgi:hypothetical protein
MDWKGKRILGYKDDEKTAYEIGKEKGFPDPVFNPLGIVKGGTEMSTRSVTVEQLQKEYEQKWILIQSEMKALKQRLERYEDALKEADTIIHDYKESRGYRERQVFEIADIIKEALKE